MTRMKPSPNAMPAPRRQRGVSLIEVLVSILVVSLGLLGAVALQATACLLYTSRCV